MSKLRVPGEWITAGASAPSANNVNNVVKDMRPTAVKASKVEARMDMSEEVAGQGLDPVTKKPMVRMFANGHPCWVGMESRIVLPVADE